MVLKFPYMLNQICIMKNAEKLEKVSLWPIIAVLVIAFIASTMSLVLALVIAA